MQFSLGALLRVAILGGATVGIALSHFLGQPDRNPLLTDLWIVSAVVAYFGVLWWRKGAPPWQV